MNCCRESHDKGRCEITLAIPYIQRLAHLAYPVLVVYKSPVRRGDESTGSDLCILAAGGGQRPELYNFNLIKMKLFNRKYSWSTLLPLFRGTFMYFSCLAPQVC